MRHYCGTRTIKADQLRRVMPEYSPGDRAAPPARDYLAALDMLIASRGERCPSPLSQDTGSRLFPLTIARFTERQEKRLTLRHSRANNREAREREQKRRRYQNRLAQAALELAQIDLANTRIVAPDAGQLGQLSVRKGAYVTAGTRLTSVVPDHKWIIANMKETQLADIRPGLPATFRVDALNGKRYNGHVEFISPAAGSEFSAISPDNATGNFVKIAQRIPVRIAIEADDMRELRPGMSVEVSIDTAAQPRDKAVKE